MPISNPVYLATEEPVHGQVRTQFGRYLRDVYARVLDQPVPAHFIEQLERLEMRRGMGRRAGEEQERCGFG